MQAGVWPGVWMARACNAPMAKYFAVGEQVIELAAIVRESRAGVEQLAEHVLHARHLLADRNLSAEPFLQVGRGGQMVGMHVGLEKPLDLRAKLMDASDEPVGCRRAGTAGLRVIVEHTVDQCTVARADIQQKVADRPGGGVEEAFDQHGARGIHIEAKEKDAVNTICTAGTCRIAAP